jgi:hypothetical protein
VTYPHAATHLPNGSDPITGFATFEQLVGVSGLITTVSNAVDLTSDQNVSGVKNFNSRPTVGGVPVLLSGEGGGATNTGDLIGVFYPLNSNPSGYITGVDLSNYASIGYVTGASGYLQGQISAINLVNLEAATGVLDERVSVLEGQIGDFALSSETGSFLSTGVADSRYYPLSSNPSNYLVAADVSSLATTSYVSGVSGHLQDQVITGLSFAGADTKTLTLYQQNGNTLTANFEDLQGTGGSFNNVVYLTGDQNVSGVKNFFSRPTVGGSGVSLSGEYIPVVRELYIDAGAMLTGISGASPQTSSVGLLSYDSYSFDSAVTGYAQFKVSISDYNQGSLKSKFHWTTSGTSGSVVWGVECASAGNGDSFPSLWGRQEVTDSFITGTGIHVTDATSSITPSGNPQIGDSLFFRVYRNTFSASDTLAVNSSLLGISIQYTGSLISAW